MTSPDNDIASLLLRVAVDYQALEEFLAVMPAIPEALEQVGARIDQAQIGSAPIFREKGAALAQAFVTGLQAEALGLNFGDLSTQITQRVFGNLDTRQIDRYRDHVRELYAVIRSEVPEVTRPLLDSSALQGLTGIRQGAEGAQGAVKALTDQLAVLRAELAALQFTSAGQLPKTIVRQGPQGVEFTPGARNVLQAVQGGAAGTFRDGIPAASNFVIDRSGGGTNLAATNRAAIEGIQRELSRSIERLAERAIPNTQALSRAIEAGPTRDQTLDQLTDALTRGATRVRAAADDQISALERAAEAARRQERLIADQNARIEGRVRGPGGDEANRIAQGVQPDRLLPFASADIVAARIDPLLSAITDNIKRNGIQQAVTLEVAKDGLARIADGHHRLLAAQALGIQVPAVLFQSSLETFPGGQPLPLGRSPFQGQNRGSAILGLSDGGFDNTLLSPAERAEVQRRAQQSKAGFSGAELRAEAARRSLPSSVLPDAAIASLVQRGFVADDAPAARPLDAREARDQNRRRRLAETEARIVEALPLDTITKAGELFSKVEVATQAAQTRGQTDIFEQVAAADDFGFARPLPPRTGAEQARLEQRQAEAAAENARQVSDEARRNREKLRERRAREAIEAERLANQPVLLFRGEKTSGFGIGEDIVQRSGAARLSDDGSRFFAPDPRVALDYAAYAGLGAGGTGRLLATQLSRQEFNQLGGPQAKEFVLPPEIVARARTVIEGSNEQLLRYRDILGGGPDSFGPFGSGRRDFPALPAGTGADPVDFGRELRQARRLAGVAGRLDLEILEGDPFGRGTVGGGLSLGASQRLVDRSTLQPALVPPSQAEVDRFTRETNRQILQANAQRRGANDGFGAFGLARGVDDTTAESLDQQLRNEVVKRGPRGQLVTSRIDSFGQMLLGNGLAFNDARRLSEEQLSALAGTATSPQDLQGQRFFPAGLINQEQARREILAQQEIPGRRDPLTLASANDLQNTRQAMRELEAQARAAAAASRDLSLANARLAITQGPLGDARARLNAAALGSAGFDPIALGSLNPAGGIPGAPQLARGGAALAPTPVGGPLPVDLEAAAARRAANVARLEAAGIDPRAFFARAEALSTAIPASALGSPLAESPAQLSERRRRAEALQLGTTQARTGGPLVAGSDGIFQPGQELVATGRGRGIPGIPGVEELRAQRAAIQDVERAVRQAANAAQPGRALVFTPRFGPFGPGGPQGEFGFGASDQFRSEQFRRAFAAGAGGAGAGGGGFGGGFGGGVGGGAPGQPFGAPLGGGGGGAAGPGVSGPFSAFFGGVRQGAFGADGSPDFFGRTVGSALRFSVAYGAAYSALRLVTTAFSEGVQGAIQFEQALTDLNIATERTGRSNEGFAFDLANTGAGRGFSPGESVAAGARAIGLFDAVDLPREQQEAIARESLDVATKIAFVSGQPLDQVQTQIAGISRSFGVEAQDQERIADVAAFVGRRTGRPAGELLQSLGQIGSLGESAGFDLEQVAAIIARLTATTGQTPQAVSGFLSQVLSRADDPRLQERLRSVGVNTNGTTLADQIEQLSQLDVSDEQRNQIVQAFGRGRSGQALGIILEQFPEIQGLAEGARTESSGLAARDFEQAINTVGGQLRTLGTELTDLFTGIASSGLLDPLVALLSAVGGVVDALDFLVDLFNEIPRPIRTAGFALLELAAALALISKFTGVGRAAAAAQGLGFIETLRTTVDGKGAVIPDLDLNGNQRVDRDFIGSNRERAQAVARTAASSARAAAVSGLAGIGGTALGAGAAGALGISAVAAGALVLGAGTLLAGAIVGTAQAINEAKDVTDLVNASGVLANTARTPEEFQAARAAAERSLAAAEERDDFKFFSKDILTLGIANLIDEIGGGSKEQKDAAQKQLDDIAKQEEEFKNRVSVDPFEAFGDFASVDAVSQGLGELSEQGFTAAQQIDLLNRAFDGLLSKTGDPNTVALLLPGQEGTFADTIATGLIDTANKGAEQIIAQDTGASGFLGGVADAVRSSPLGAITTLVETVAGGAGRAAGSSGFFGRIGGFLTGAGDALGEGIQEFLPGVQSDREQAEENREAAESFQAQLADPALRDKLNQGVADVLAERGLDTSNGPVSLGPDDVEAIKARQIAILEETLGSDFEDLPKEVREAYEASLEESVRTSIEGFGGTEVTATNAKAYLDSVRALAGKTGADLALTSGSGSEGAAETVRLLEGGRGKVTEAISKIDAEIAAGGLSEDESKQKSAERQRLIQLLAQYDLDILAAVKAESAARRQDITALADLRKSTLQPGDVQGGIRADLDAIAAQLALPGLEDNERIALEAQRNRLNTQAGVDARQTAGQRALNRLNPRDQAGRLRQQIANTREQIANTAPGAERERLIAELQSLQVQQVDLIVATRGQRAINRINPRDLQNRLLQQIANVQDQINQLPDGLEREQLIQQRDDLIVQAVDRDIQTQGTRLLNRFNPRNTDGRLRQQIEIVRAQLSITPDGLEREQLIAQLADLEQQYADYLVQNLAAFRLANINPNNSLALAIANEQNALDAFTAAQATGDPLAINQAAGAATQAGFARQGAQIDTLISQNRLNTVTDPRSEIQSANQALYEAQINVQRYDVDTKEYYDALFAVRQAEQGVATAYRSYSQTLRRLGSDLTDPLEQAQLDLADITENLNKARAEGAAPDTIANLELDQRNAANEAERIAFEQSLEGFRVRNELGEISDQAYLDYLLSEQARLENITDKTKQQQDFLNQINQEIMSLNDQLQGQFNLGDISVPAPFEARRILATPGGGGAQVVQTVNLTINGGDMNAVRTVVADYLGPVALSRTPTVTPTRI